MVSFAILLFRSLTPQRDSLYWFWGSLLAAFNHFHTVTFPFLWKPQALIIAHQVIPHFVNLFKKKGIQLLDLPTVVTQSPSSKKWSSEMLRSVGKRPITCLTSCLIKILGHMLWSQHFFAEYYPILSPSMTGASPSAAGKPPTLHPCKARTEAHTGHVAERAASALRVTGCGCKVWMLSSLKIWMLKVAALPLRRFTKDTRKLNVKLRGKRSAECKTKWTILVMLATQLLKPTQRNIPQSTQTIQSMNLCLKTMASWELICHNKKMVALDYTRWV